MASRKQWIRRLGKQISQVDAAQHSIRTAAEADADKLHQLRIGLRSLRIQLVPIAQHGRLHAARKTLGAVNAASNALRDRDVMLQLVANWPAPYADEARRLIDGRPLDTGRARRDLSPADWDEQVGALPRLLRQHVPPRAALQRTMRKTARHYRRKARAELAALVPGCSPVFWHQTRITLKKVRYLHDELQDWLPQRWRRLGKAAKPAQDALGHLHDLDVLQLQFGASFSAALNLQWQRERAAALVQAELAAEAVMRALRGGKMSKPLRGSARG